MKKFIFLIVLMIGFFAGSQTGLQAQSIGIAATVNDEAISMMDLNNRIDLILGSAGLPATSANRKSVSGEALESLIDEMIRIQEARKQNLEVTEEDIIQGFEALAQQNQMTGEQFAEILRRQGIPKVTLESQIRSQVAWMKVVRSVLRPRVEVTETDISTQMQMMQGNIGDIEYELYEIFLPVLSSETAEDVKAQAQALVQDIKFNGAKFSDIALRHSKAPSAAQGGNRGWVKSGALPDDLNDIMINMPEGQISSPIRRNDGYYILSVSGKRSVTGEALPSEDTMLNQIGLGRLNRLAESYFDDLKAAAYIDRRL